jgi:hypothetical protein
MAGCRRAAEGRCPKCHRIKSSLRVGHDESAPT